MDGMRARDCRSDQNAAENAASEWRMQIEKAQSVQELGRMIRLEAQRRAAAANGWSTTIPQPASECVGLEGRE